MNISLLHMKKNSISFQSISDDQKNPIRQVKGDFAGFCLAWCMWYIEERIRNNMSGKR